MPKQQLKLYVSSLVFICFLILLTGLALAEGPAVPHAAPPAQPGGGPASPGGVPASAPPAPSLFSTLVPLILMFGILYLLLIRPQQKKMKEHQNLLANLAHGDEVVTSSGFLGKVTGITDKVVTLELAENIKVKILKSQISQVVKGQIKDL